MKLMVDCAQDPQDHSLVFFTLAIVGRQIEKQVCRLVNHGTEFFVPYFVINKEAE
jgi:hypothetical protein